MASTGFMMINIVVCIVEAWVLCDYYSAMLGRRYQSKSLYFWSFFVAYALLYLINIAENPLWNLSYSVLLSLFLAFLLFERRGLNWIFFSVLYLLLVVMTEFMSRAIINWFVPKDPLLWLEFSLDRVFSIILSKLFLFAIVQFIASQFGHHREKRITVKYLLSFLALTLFTVVLLNILLYFTINTPTAAAQHLLIALALGLLVVNVVFYSIFQRALTAEAKERENQALENRRREEGQYWQLLERYKAEAQVSMHDYKKHLAVVDGFLAAGDEAGARDYLAQLSDSLRPLDVRHFSGSKVADIVLNDKCYQAQQQGVAVQIDANVVDLRHIDNLSLCRILANLLDNAIEAAAVSEEKWVKVAIALTSPYFIAITVTNSADTPPKSQDGRLQSTKGGAGRGWGIRSLEEACARYGGHFDWQYQAEGKIFQAAVLLPTADSYRNLVAEGILPGGDGQ